MDNAPWRGQSHLNYGRQIYVQEGTCTRFKHAFPSTTPYYFAVIYSLFKLRVSIHGCGAVVVVDLHRRPNQLLEISIELLESSHRFIRTSGRRIIVIRSKIDEQLLVCTYQPGAQVRPANTGYGPLHSVATKVEGSKGVLRRLERHGQLVDAAVCWWLNVSVQLCTLGWIDELH